MVLIEKHRILAEISPPLDPFLASQLLDEFISSERRFIQRDWEPAQLDGGQFCEVSARIVYHLDSGNLNLDKPFGECLDYVEDDHSKHSVQPRRDALHIAKVLRTVYKFRSQRGAVHISPTYTPNHMDSKLVIEGVRWVMNDLLRLSWTGDREAAAAAIRELLQFDVPCIGRFQDVIVVQRTDLAPEEEVLVLLHYAGEEGFSRLAIGKAAQISPASVTRALQALTSPKMRQVVQIGSGNYRLTDLGAKRIREQLAEKLLIS
jgi:hypothetical protein